MLSIVSPMWQRRQLSDDDDNDDVGGVGDVQLLAALVFFVIAATVMVAAAVGSILAARRVQLHQEQQSQSQHTHLSSAGSNGSGGQARIVSTAAILPVVMLLSAWLAGSVAVALGQKWLLSFWYGGSFGFPLVVATVHVLAYQVAVMLWWTTDSSHQMVWPGRFTYFVFICPMALSGALGLACQLAALQTLPLSLYTVMTFGLGAAAVSMLAIQVLRVQQPSAKSWTATVTMLIGVFLAVAGTADSLTWAGVLYALAAIAAAALEWLFEAHFRLYFMEAMLLSPAAGGTALDAPASIPMPIMTAPEATMTPSVSTSTSSYASAAVSMDSISLSLLTTPPKLLILLILTLVFESRALDQSAIADNSGVLWSGLSVAFLLGTMSLLTPVCKEHLQGHTSPDAIQTYRVLRDVAITTLGAATFAESLGVAFLLGLVITVGATFWLRLAHSEARTDPLVDEAVPLYPGAFADTGTKTVSTAHVSGTRHNSARGAPGPPRHNRPQPNAPFRALSGLDQTELEPLSQRL